MNVFVTGGTGLIGRAVVSELITHGHTVTVLARSDAAAQQVTAAGATPLAGHLGDADLLAKAAADADGAVHLAFSNDFSTPDALVASVAEEVAAVRAMGEALVGSGRPFVTISGTPPIPGQVTTEDDDVTVPGPLSGRAEAGRGALALADRGVRSSVIRLPRTVHDEGRGGFAGLLTDIARQTGVSGYPGDGTQRWPAVHARDAASLFRIALESGPAGHAWHAVDDEGDAVRDIAAVIGRRLGLPVEPVAEEHFGMLGPIFAMDQPSSSAQTRAALGWTPTHPKLLADLESIQP